MKPGNVNYISRGMEGVKGFAHYVMDEQLESPHPKYNLYAVGYDYLPTVKGLRWLGEVCPCGSRGVYTQRKDTDNGSRVVRYCPFCGLSYYYVIKEDK